jgi:hypothetical protein
MICLNHDFYRIKKIAWMFLNLGNQGNLTKIMIQAKSEGFTVAATSDCIPE